MRKWILAAVAIVTVAGCKNKKVEAPKTCTRAASAVPQDFYQKASIGAGAVTTADCSVLAVGVSASGQTVIAKYDPAGKADPTFGQNSVYQPFYGRYPGYTMTVYSMAVMADGYLALGSYVRPDGASELFVFKLTENGLVETLFGPRHDGVVHGEIVDGVSVTGVQAPTFAEDGVTIPVSYSQADGRVITRLVHISSNGRDPIEAQTFDVPASCDIINYNGFNNGVTFALMQNGCSQMSWSASGGAVAEKFDIPTDGSFRTNALFGDFALHYEGTNPMMISRDNLGHARDQYMAVVGKQTFICGSPVSADRTYLVFSNLEPGQDGWLDQCWFL